MLVDRKRVGFAIRGMSRDVFEPHCGLALKADFAGEPQKRGGGIEKASHRCRLENANVFVDQFQRSTVASGKMKWRRLEIRTARKLPQKSSRALHRKSSGRVSAGQICASEMMYAIETGAHIPDEKLATPDCSIISKSSAIETDPNDPPIPGLPFRQNGRDVGPVVLNRDFARGGKIQRVGTGCVLRMR